MKRRWLGALAVAVAAFAIVAYKQLKPPPRAAASQHPPASPAVLLFADPAEAESSCGCGEVIRLVRAAAVRGVRVREVRPGAEPALEREYQVSVAPSVVVLDRDGRVVSRHLGESPNVIASIRAALERLPGEGR